jgi:glucans biosynthesis protein
LIRKTDDRLVHALAWSIRAISTIALLLALPPDTAKGAFDFDDVVEKARALAGESFQDPRGRVPDWLLSLSYDEWRDIRFRASDALWNKEKLRFEVQFFHPGLFYDRTVRINSVDASGQHAIDFSPSLFDYGKNKFASRIPQDLGFAGFRLHYPINRPDYKDEVIVFLGASYFRAVGMGSVFGISARGLAIDTGLPSGEEFPYFKEFWLVRPTAKATDLELFALLDSRRVTGAYRFVVYPGEQTIVDVEATIFLRDEVGKLGIAPLTSMFFSGENTLQHPVDYRPEVHDSDGLLILQKTGEWIWRPLENPERLQQSAFQSADIKGFGLLQRDRDFTHYEDLETRPDHRPSVWIEPRGEWGDGYVDLVEIPTHTDANDNIVSAWVSAEPPKPGKAFHVSYRMSWFAADATRSPGGWVLSTRRDEGTFENAQRFVIDFVGKELAKTPADTVLRAQVTVGVGDQKGELLEQQVQKNPVTGGWRLTFQVPHGDDEPLELRAFLQKDEDVLTETWSYVVQP